MPFEIVTIHCLSDNYAFLLHEKQTGQTALIDAPEAAPILAELRARNWTLNEIWVTHHHGDHIDGLAELVAEYAAKTLGASKDMHRLPPLDFPVTEADTHCFAGHEMQVLDVSGHTVGHLAFYVPDAKAVFTADSLMALGCGRLFEGTPDQMWESLCKIAALPDNTSVCSGHEYTATNTVFALTIEPDNKALQNRATDISRMRARGQATVPSLLSDELATNPFLRANLKAVKTAIGMPGASDVATFTAIRQRKDVFR